MCTSVCCNILFLLLSMGIGYILYLVGNTCNFFSLNFIDETFKQLFSCLACFSACLNCISNYLQDVIILAFLHNIHVYTQLVILSLFQAGFGFYSPSASYTTKGTGLGVFLYLLTYLLDTILAVDIIISLKKSYLLVNHCNGKYTVYVQMYVYTCMYNVHVYMFVML